MGVRASGVPIFSKSTLSTNTKPDMALLSSNPGEEDLELDLVLLLGVDVILAEQVAVAVAVAVYSLSYNKL